MNKSVSRNFTLQDQLDFAALSGDFNPVHIDPLYARRTIFGKAVVRGVHLLMWGLESFLSAENFDSIRITNIRADFWKAIGLNEYVVCTWEHTSTGKIILQISSDNILYVKCSFTLSHHDKCFDNNKNNYEMEDTYKLQNYIELKPSEITENKGNLQLKLNYKLLKNLFPKIFVFVPIWQTATILGTTRLVGMECPGLHSIFSRLKITFGSEPVFECQWQAESFDKTTKMLNMTLSSGNSISGEIIAFHRGMPVKQISFNDAQKLVVPDEFAKERVLVIGGSRGLGEVTAKLFSAGGAEVILTYAKGKDDAEKIVQEISEQGGKISCRHFDITSSNTATLIESNEKIPTIMCYFATPFIFSATQNKFSEQLFNQFCKYYITNFYHIAQYLIAFGTTKIFYPSSTAIDEIPSNMCEYASAKIAGELLCRFIEQSHSNVIVQSFRFPRMETDQTQTLTTIENIPPAGICLEQIRLLCLK
ncbi:MAG: SDR family NAD(P)-dependent oxidoreductase [Planctomycetaceae bacterium]|nr:SDR family NAD(P)-dependent oxidoreductase [Planctomycetaceae bacterium]